ncbi:hypothetical protein C8R44DRAFT_990620 [Mycena epipterygia]|nr:hypothetical protein C8R44DRAFT_990620 [Mycena epipterygia]
MCNMQVEDRTLQIANNHLLRVPGSTQVVHGYSYASRLSSAVHLRDLHHFRFHFRPARLQLEELQAALLVLSVPLLVLWLHRVLLVLRLSSLVLERIHAVHLCHFRHSRFRFRPARLQLEELQAALVLSVPLLVLWLHCVLPVLRLSSLVLDLRSRRHRSSSSLCPSWCCGCTASSRCSGCPPSSSSESTLGNIEILGSRRLCHCCCYAFTAPSTAAPSSLRANGDRAIVPVDNLRRLRLRLARSTSSESLSMPSSPSSDSAFFPSACPSDDCSATAISDILGGRSLQCYCFAPAACSTATSASAPSAISTAHASSTALTESSTKG